MSAVMHTGGPWHVTAGGQQIRSAKDQIARVWMMRSGEGVNNAHLLAAAPDLLAVVDKFLEVANLCPPDDLVRELGALVKLAAAASDKAKATAP